MPTYEFKCPNGHEFERFHMKMSEAPSTVACPECGEMAIRKVSGGSGFLFKGSGFYITDYGKDGKKDQRKDPKSRSDTDTKSAGSEGGSSAESPKSETSGSAEGGKPKPTGGGSSPGGSSKE